jgi:ABC-type uncharacterized transport system substrate-binding protein
MTLEVFPPRAPSDRLAALRRAPRSAACAAAIRLCVLALALVACVVAALSIRSAAATEARKRVLHVDSYHAGNEWNDRISRALKGELAAKNVDVRVVYLDAKRRSAEEAKRAAALDAVRAIEEFKPDVVTISDDDAAQYLLMPYFREAKLPFVFCGLNWDASVYGLPYANTTGMVEVSPIPQLVRLLKQYARGARIGFLAESTSTKRKELTYHERLFGVTYDKVYLVSSFAEWKQAFLAAQNEVDMLLVLGVGALPDWDVKAAAQFAEGATVVPSGTDFEWLMPVSLIGVVKSPEEQGRWAAQAALRIIDGTQPSQIPLTYNRDGEFLFNARLGARLGIIEAPRLARIMQ